MPSFAVFKIQVVSSTFLNARGKGHCTMQQAIQGKKVRVRYTGHLMDGTLFDQTEPKQTFDFTIGKGDVIPGFENAVVGLESGQETKTIIKCDNAYGQVRDDLVMEFQRSDFPEEMALKKGLNLKATFENDMTMNVKITHISDDIVIVDGNHPLAGKDLIFNIKLIEIV